MKPHRIALLVGLLTLNGGAPARAGAARDADAGPLADAVLYQFMPIAWRDSDDDEHRFGDFGGMTDSLDYLSSLGVTGVWMNPIFPSPAYHGYQHGAADRTNPWFGDESQFVAFVEAAHKRHIKVFIDFVAYGINQDSAWFRGARGNPDSPYDSWLAFTNDANTKFRGYTYTTWNGDRVGFVHWDLRHDGPKDLVTRWASHWLDPNGDGDFADGVDGYRLDHVWAKYPHGPNGWGYNLDSFWLPWRAALKKVNPDAITFAEQAQWQTHGQDLLPAFDAAFTKPFEFAARDALRTERAKPLYDEMRHTIDALDGAPAGRTFLGIVGDHDVERLASAIGADGPASMDKGRAAAAVLLLQPFPPIIYMGDEIGMKGVQARYGSDANDIPVREPFKWTAVNAGSPMTNYWILNRDAYRNRYSRDNDGRSVQEQEGVEDSLLETYRTLIHLRRGHAALATGAYTPVAASSEHVWAFLRGPSPEDGPSDQPRPMLVAINLHGQPVAATLELPRGCAPGSLTDVVTGRTVRATRGATPEGEHVVASITLPRYGWRVFAVADADGAGG